MTVVRSATGANGIGKATRSNQRARAPTIDPSTDALSPFAPIPLPATNAPPPCENWTMTGAFAFAAVSITALMVLEPVQLAAGRAKWLAFANAKISETASPVRTPAGNWSQRLTTPRL